MTSMEPDPNKTNRRNLIVGAAAVGVVVLAVVIVVIWIWRRSKAEPEAEKMSLDHSAVNGFDTAV